MKPHRTAPRALVPLLLATPLFAAACGDAPAALDAAGHAEAARFTVSAETVAGRAAFAASCATCHASGDGFDLALFGFADSTIVRRAVFHVDTATALDIVAHVRSLDVAPMGRDARPFQVPRAASDADFARRLFGRDAWPAGLGEEDLLAMDPTRVAAAVAFPLWSDEASNLDWMPGAPLPPAVLGSPDGAVQRTLAAYRARPSPPALVRAVQALRRAANDGTSGPCFQSDDGALRDPSVCFETTRWTASLGAQHALRAGVDLSEPVAGSTAVADAFWDVGQAARRGLLKNKAPVDHAEENWVSWMYMGWVLAPGNHASGYTASGLGRVGLPRHATFVALRSMASRPEASHLPFADLNVAARQAPLGWLPGAYATGLAVLEARVARGWEPGTDAAREEAKAALSMAADAVSRRLGAVRAAPLVTRTKALLETLDA
ncbi:MAG: hypothetical protein AMXMBFR53_28570 [Gemmatimonadota bacterium]